MADKKPEPKNVKGLIQKHTKPPKKQPTVAKKIRLRGGQPPAKGKPANVLKLITDALKRKGQ